MADPVFKSEAIEAELISIAGKIIGDRDFNEAKDLGNKVQAAITEMFEGKYERYKMAILVEIVSAGAGTTHNTFRLCDPSSDLVLQVSHKNAKGIMCYMFVVMMKY
mmetsp:Transcript_162/g.409  ORF Transcript_162/g.409 Transcript_162/m.409 type:complete len:106 (+) Transcript_162:76-393(+)